MSALFLHQQSRGGIIDVEAEESKLLVLTDSTEREPSPERVPEPQTESPPGPSLPQPNRHYRGGYRGFNRHPRGKGRNCRSSAR